MSARRLHDRLWQQTAAYRGPGFADARLDTEPAMPAPATTTCGSPAACR